MAEVHNPSQTNDVRNNQTPPQVLSTPNQPVLVLRPPNTEPIILTPQLKAQIRKQAKTRLSPLGQEFRIINSIKNLNKLREDAAELQEVANAMNLVVWYPAGMPVDLLSKVYWIQFHAVQKGIKDHTEETKFVSNLFNAAEVKGLESRAAAELWTRQFYATASSLEKSAWRKLEKLTAAFFRAHNGLNEVHSILDDAIVAYDKVKAFVAAGDDELGGRRGGEVETEAAWRHRHENNAELELVFW
ncbi:hypothetical protein H2200_005848 [Cladophialophora chaetospira]|uniref:Uncharacterized protein n=1 Tax=Cladophialophora chaetospira TaxID=386627 RepID=A0AA38X9Y8_9EURO|nr:hypothetical protein H2200_005848 [Cladophialophora chaetospira]